MTGWLWILRLAFRTLPRSLLSEILSKSCQLSPGFFFLNSKLFLTPLLIITCYFAVMHCTCEFSTQELLNLEMRLHRENLAQLSQTVNEDDDDQVHITAISFLYLLHLFCMRAT